MSTTRNADFQTMLNEYLPNELLKNEMFKRDYFLSNIENDDSAKKDVIIPWKSTKASTITFNSLAADTDISQSAFLRGKISALPEVWGSMVFNSSDLLDHNGKIPESTFLKILPNEIEDFMQYQKEVVSVQMMSGPHFSTALADGQAGGTIVVDHIDRWTIGQKATIDDNNSATADVYCIAIDVNTGATGYPGSGTITVSATSGGAALDISAYSLAQVTKFYHPGIWDGTTATCITSLKSGLLSAALGGSSTLHGKTKLSYPILQPILVSGAAITATNILDKIFDAVTSARAKGKGQANTVILSYKHLGSIYKVLESQKGGYRVVGEPKANLYGWDEITIGSVKGNVKIVAIQEAEDSEIYVLDMSSFKFYSNGGFRKHKNPDGNEYYTVRATTGYKFIVDIALFGEMGFLKPCNNLVIYSVANY